MKLFITGASGFLGQYVVAAALRAGHEVQAVIRPTTDETRLAWHQHLRVKFARLDLRQSRGISEALEGVDTVLHLAATKGGDFYDRFAGTVIGTENLLNAIVNRNVKRLVAISTFSVYDYLKMSPYSLLDESAPIEEAPENRDGYAQTKLIQEEMIRAFERESGISVTIIRPGMIYGRECLWHALLGAELGENRWLRIGRRSPMPMTYVENCAEAIVLAASCPEATGQTINIVDDNPPRQNQYVQALLKHEKTPPKLIPMSWTLMQLMATLGWFVRQRLLHGEAKLPGILVPAQLYARFKPLRFSNQQAKKILGWDPQYSLEEALQRSYSSQKLLVVSEAEN
ncbi:MAG: NAD(P)-dependent oxidoreductase [Cyanobacteria bacterium J06639_14]